MRYSRTIGSFIVAIAVTGCGGSNGAPFLQQGSASQQSAQRTMSASLGSTSILPMSVTAIPTMVSACPKPIDETRATCFASIRTDSIVSSVFPDSVNGLTPSDLSSIYAYPAPGNQGSSGSGQTVAIAVAGDYAGAESDLGVYRAHFGLSPCTMANGCLSKVGAGATNTSSPSGNPETVTAHATSTNALGWASETDADTEIVSAVCPNCKIMLAEAASDSLADLTAAVGAAIGAHASIVNASFGAPESSVDKLYAPTYENGNHVKVVAAAGDWGFGVYFPASDGKVIAVGGTTLSVTGNSVVETVWAGTGSGCSTVFGQQAWQYVNIAGICKGRTVNDVAAVADPNTGVAVYDSMLTKHGGGWTIFGGTSIAAPIITGMYALSGNTGNGVGAQQIYANAQKFRAVTMGSNGTCALAYLCQAGPIYNGPTGLGIPQGLAGFNSGD